MRAVRVAFLFVGWQSAVAGGDGVGVGGVGVGVQRLLSFGFR